MSVSSPSTADTSVDSREALGVALVDIVALAGLVTYGSLHHGADPLSEPLGTVEIVFPFLLGWLVVAPLAGLYNRSTVREPIQAARWTLIGWLAAANVGLLLRGSAYFDGGVASPFPLVMTGVGLLVLLPWRVGYAVFIDQRTSSNN